MNTLSISLLQAQPTPESNFMPLIMILAMIAIFYFFMYRPQRKRQKELQKFQNSLINLVVFDMVSLKCPFNSGQKLLFDRVFNHGIWHGNSNYAIFIRDEVEVRKIDIKSHLGDIITNFIQDTLPLVWHLNLLSFFQLYDFSTVFTDKNNIF